MMIVCEDHIKEGLTFFQSPHICKTNLGLKCRFCNQSAEYELDYYISTPIWLKSTTKKEEVSETMK